MSRGGETKPEAHAEEEASAGEPVSELQRILSSLCPIPPAELTPEKTLGLDLSLDSLGRVEFFSTVQENLGVQISDGAAAEIFTVEDLVHLVVDLLGGKDVQGKEVRQSWTEILSQAFDEADAQKVGEILVRRPDLFNMYELMGEVEDAIRESTMARIRLFGSDGKA